MHAGLMHFIKAWSSFLTDSRLDVVCKRHTVSTHSPPVVTHTIVCNVTPIAGGSVRQATGSALGVDNDPTRTLLLSPTITWTRRRLCQSPSGTYALPLGWQSHALLDHSPRFLLAEDDSSDYNAQRAVVAAGELPTMGDQPE